MEVTTGGKKELIGVRVARGVAVVTLQRPERANALVPEMIDQLVSALDRLEADGDVRVVVLTGSGRFFCSGLDLGGAAARADAADGAVALFDRLHRFAKPLVARVQGPALGGGVGLMMCCDIRVADEAAYVAFSEVRRGIVPAVIAAYVVPKIGRSASADLMLTGRRCGATEAARLGVVHAAVPTADLDARVEAYVADLLRGGPHAMGVIKRLVDHVAAHGHAENLDYVRAVFARMMGSEEAAHGIGAFLQKREPDWTGFAVAPSKL